MKILKKKYLKPSKTQSLEKQYINIKIIDGDLDMQMRI